MFPIVRREMVRQISSSTASAPAIASISSSIDRIRFRASTEAAVHKKGLPPVTAIVAPDNPKSRRWIFCSVETWRPEP
jgi:hypothetical protein